MPEGSVLPAVLPQIMQITEVLPELKNKTTKLYNILFPVWLLVFMPTPLWLILIPLNYAIDCFVLRRSLRGTENADRICSCSSWKICLAGFAADLAGAAFMFAEMLLSDRFLPGLSDRIGYGLSMDPFYNIWTFCSVLIAVLISAAVIFFADRAILRKDGADAESALKAALNLAVFTAPYLFFFPSKLIY